MPYNEIWLAKYEVVISFILDNLTREVGTRKYVEIIKSMAERR